MVDVFCLGLVLIQGLFEEFLVGLPFRVLFLLPFKFQRFCLKFGPFKFRAFFGDPLPVSRRLCMCILLILLPR